MCSRTLSQYSVLLLLRVLLSTRRLDTVLHPCLHLRLAIMSDSQLYEETFSIGSINSQKYDRVSRIAATSSSHDTQLTLDVNTELYPMSTGESFQLVLASTLALDGTKDERGWRDLSRSGEQTLADMYDYVCRGKIYRFEEGNGENL